MSTDEEGKGAVFCLRGQLLLLFSEGCTEIAGSGVGELERRDIKG